MASISSIFEFILPKKKAKTDGNAYTDTYRPGNSNTLTAPDYQEHIKDLYDNRISQNSNELLQELFLSAAKHNQDYGEQQSVRLYL